MEMNDFWVTLIRNYFMKKVDVNISKECGYRFFYPLGILFMPFLLESIAEESLVQIDYHHSPQILLRLLSSHSLACD